MADASALVPDISLGVKAPAVGAGIGLESLGGLAQALNSFNQNRLFQQTFAARQKAGELLATSDPSDPEAGIRALLGNPQTAGFAPEIINSLRAAEQAQVSIQGAQQTQATEGLAGFMKMLPAVQSNPGAWQPMTSAVLANVAPGVRDRVASGMESVRQALTSGLEKLPPDQQQAAFRNRMAGMLYAGMGPAAGDVLKGTYGTPSTVDLGGGVAPGLTLPPQLGGGFTPAQAPLGKTLSPQLPTMPGGVPGMPVGGAYGTQGAPAPSLPTSSAPAAVSEYTPLPVGTPLYDPKRDGTSPSVGTGLGGLKVQSPQQVEQNKGLIDEFTGSGLREYTNQNSAKALLQYMDNSFDNLVRGGGFQQPGAAADFRGNVAKAIGTLAQIAGKNPSDYSIDMSKVANAEEFNKQTKVLGTQILTTMLGNQREAAQTIDKFISSVPGINNTYMGGKLLLDTYQAAIQRGLDERNFKNAWQANPTNQGSLLGAAEAFNNQFPAEGYAKNVLAKHGMNERGLWQSPEALRGAVAQGYLTPGEAKILAVKQFGASPPGANQ